MEDRRYYQKCIGGHYHPVVELPFPITHQALAETDIEGNFAVRQLLPGTI